MRKPHKKNRTGCSACKRRRIKCPEQKPICHICRRKGEECIYPQNLMSSCSDNVSDTSTTVSASLSSQPSYSLQDIRFFHHFLTTAFPCLPSCDDSVWTNIIPLYAEQSSYLMHAMMALGASHLGALLKVDYSKTAQLHRNAAITGLQRAMADKLDSVTDYDTAFAGCHILGFQSVYMDDAVADLVTMTRGCHLLMARVQEQRLSSVFGERFECEKDLKPIDPRLSSPHDPVFVQKGIEALRNLECCLATSAQLFFLKLLIRVLELIQSSPQAGCMQFHKLYEYWYTLDHQSFAEFVDTTNSITQVLITYLLAIQLLMYPFLAMQWPDRAHHSRLHTFTGTIMWAHQMGSRITAPHLQRYLEWPRAVVASMQLYNADDFSCDSSSSSLMLESSSSSSSPSSLSLSSPSSSSSGSFPIV